MTDPFLLARQAAQELAIAPNSTRKALLNDLAQALRKNTDQIITANQEDLQKLQSSDPLYDRLLLDQERIESLAQSVEKVAALPSPLGIVQHQHRPKNGLQIEQITVPLGVIGMIYEARPNVTIDALTLGWKAGNSLILRGGSAAEHSNQMLVNIAQQALEQHQLPSAAVQLWAGGREQVKELLTARGKIDVIIPRGGRSLIDFVRQESLVPVIETGAGVCHTFVEASAKLPEAARVVTNAKARRVSICNCLDTVLVQASVLEPFLKLLSPLFSAKSITIKADPQSYQVLERESYPLLEKATKQDWGKEFLSPTAAIKTVPDYPAALSHISQYSSQHSEAILTEDQKLADDFLQRVDAAAVYANASTQFTDGGEFGLGAEMGVSTQKLHTRGPFALSALTTTKWMIRGSGQCRGD